MNDLISRSEAKARGLTRFFTGKPCSQGHICEHMVSNWDCVLCIRARSSAAYGDEQRVKSRMRMKKLYQSDPEKFRRRSQSNYAADPITWRVRSAATRARHFSTDGNFSSDDIKRKLQNQRGRCLCGTDLSSEYHIDHIMPLCRGGSNWPENIQLLCPRCNLYKWRWTMSEWLPSIQNMTE